MTTKTAMNGVDVPGLLGALDAVKQQPAAAAFQFRARNRWLQDTHSESTIHDFFGLGEEQTHTREHTFEADHPQQLMATDMAPSPVEHLLHALAACITAGIGNIASVRGVNLKKVESTVTGDIDLQGLLGLDPGVRNGFQGIDVQIRIEGDADAEALRQIVDRSVARSAVFDMLTNGTRVSVNVGSD